jgi:uncharacterized phage protein gp47/JayE
MYRERTDIVAEMISALVAAIPDAYTGDDGVTRIIIEIEAGQLENLYLANQLLLEDMFISSASYQALIQHGEQYGISLQQGTLSSGTLTFAGDGGTYVPIGTEVAYDPGQGLPVVYFVTTTDGTIPAPGNPVAPLAALGVAGNLSGTYEYYISFVTAAGESLPSPASAAVSPVNQQVNLTAIPLGGPGTISRRVYRDKNGAGTPRRVTEIANNTATTYTDNIIDATVASNPQTPVDDTAHQITVNGQAEASGVEGNVAVGAITDLANAPATLLSVINPTAFTGASDPEDTEDFRTRLLAFVQNPQTGSVSDLEAWAEDVAGVESATVFSNTPGAGQVTVRITATGGGVPSAQLISDVQAALNAQDIANITITVASFVAVPTNVTVDVTTSGTYVLADVTASVQQAISDYINQLPVGGTLYLSGIVDAVFGLPGIIDVTVTVPASNQTTAADSKRTPGTITVT